MVMEITERLAAPLVYLCQYDKIKCGSTSVNGSRFCSKHLTSGTSSHQCAYVRGGTQCKNRIAATEQRTLCSTHLAVKASRKRRRTEAPAHRDTINKTPPLALHVFRIITQERQRLKFKPNINKRPLEHLKWVMKKERLDRSPIYPSGMESECLQHDTPHDNVSLGRDAVPMKSIEMSDIRCRGVYLSKVEEKLHSRLDLLVHQVNSFKRSQANYPRNSKAVAAAARSSVAKTTQLLNETEGLDTRAGQCPCTLPNRASKYSCCMCARRALPFTKYCMQHILQDREQQLFSHCNTVVSEPHSGSCLAPTITATGKPCSLHSLLEQRYGVTESHDIETESSESESDGEEETGPLLEPLINSWPPSPPQSSRRSVMSSPPAPLPDTNHPLESEEMDMLPLQPDTILETSSLPEEPDIPLSVRFLEPNNNLVNKRPRTKEEDMQLRMAQYMKYGGQPGAPGVPPPGYYFHPYAAPNFPPTTPVHFLQGYNKEGEPIYGYHDKQQYVVQESGSRPTTPYSNQEMMQQMYQGRCIQPSPAPLTPDSPKKKSSHKKKRSAKTPPKERRPEPMRDAAPRSTPPPSVQLTNPYSQDASNSGSPTSAASPATMALLKSKISDNKRENNVPAPNVVPPGALANHPSPQPPPHVVSQLVPPPPPQVAHPLLPPTSQGALPLVPPPPSPAVHPLLPPTSQGAHPFVPPPPQVAPSLVMPPSQVAPPNTQVSNAKRPEAPEHQAPQKKKRSGKVPPPEVLQQQQLAQQQAALMQQHMRQQQQPYFAYQPPMYPADQQHYFLQMYMAQQGSPGQQPAIQHVANLQPVQMQQPKPASQTNGPVEQQPKDKQALSNGETNNVPHSNSNSGSGKAAPSATANPHHSAVPAPPRAPGPTKPQVDPPANGTGNGTAAPVAQSTSSAPNSAPPQVASEGSELSEYQRYTLQHQRQRQMMIAAQSQMAGQYFPGQHFGYYQPTGAPSPHPASPKPDKKRKKVNPPKDKVPDKRKPSLSSPSSNDAPLSSLQSLMTTASSGRLPLETVLPEDDPTPNKTPLSKAVPSKAAVPAPNKAAPPSKPRSKKSSAKEEPGDRKSPSVTPNVQSAQQVPNNYNQAMNYAAYYGPGYTPMQLMPMQLMKAGGYVNGTGNLFLRMDDATGEGGQDAKPVVINDAILARNRPSSVLMKNPGWVERYISRKQEPDKRGKGKGSPSRRSPQKPQHRNLIFHNTEIGTISDKLAKQQKSAEQRSSHRASCNKTKEAAEVPPPPVDPPPAPPEKPHSRPPSGPDSVPLSNQAEGVT